MNILPVEKQNLIARWLARRMSIRATAALAGVNRNSVLRYKKKIDAGTFSLTYSPILDRRNPRAVVHIKLSRSALDRLEDVGDQLGIDRGAVIAKVIETVVADDLFDAVIG